MPPSECFLEMYIRCIARAFFVYRLITHLYTALYTRSYKTTGSEGDIYNRPSKFLSACVVSCHLHIGVSHSQP